MLSLTGCISPKTIEDKASVEALQTIKDAKALIISLPASPKPREKLNLEDLTWQDIDEYITYQNNYISDLQLYILHMQAIVDILNVSTQE